MTESSSEKEEDPPLSKERLDALNQELISASFITSDVIYIELRLLRDYKLGAVLRHILDTASSAEAKKAYEMIQAHRSDYAHRAYDDLDYYIPGLPLTNAQVETLLTETMNPDAILNASPMTEFIHTLLSNLMINANHSEVQNKSGQIRFLVNTYPLDISEKQQRLVSLYLTRLCAVDVEIFCCDPTDLDKTVFDQCDEFYSFYCKKFVENTYFHKKLESLTYLKKRLFIPKYFGTTYTKNYNTLQDQTYTHAVLNTMITFEYMPMTYVSPAIPETPPDEEASSS